MENFEGFESKYLNLLTDFGFHKIFENKDLLMDFLNEVVREEGLITDIQYLPPEQLGDLETDRKAIFDIFCATENGDYFIVEMQRAKQAFFRERSIYYASLPIQKQAQRGIWDFRLKGVYMVAILDFVLFDESEGDGEEVIEYVYLMRERTQTLYSNKLKFAFVELPKFRKREEELETHFDKWLFLLKNLSTLKDRPVSVQGGIFEKLFQIAEIKRLTKKDMESYNKSILEYRDVRSAVEYAREEGFEKGREEGIEKGREERNIYIIQRCLQKNMPIEEIIELTGFSKEQIIRWREKNGQ